MPDRTDGEVTAVGKAQIAQRIRRLLKRLSWFTPAIVLFAVAAVGVSFYLLEARPMARANLLAHEQEAANSVKARFENQVAEVERALFISRASVRQGLDALGDPGAFNRLLIPILQQHGIINAMRLANESGREILLSKTPTGWQNRIVDVARRGFQQRRLEWRDANTLVGEQSVVETYDPRQQPWFLGAMATPENLVHWTDPYAFQFSGEPGFAVSTRWTDVLSGEQWILSCSVPLLDLSKFTSRLNFGKHGQVALLTTDGKIIGLPRSAEFTDDEALKKAMLQAPGALGLRKLEAAWNLAREVGGAAHAAEQRILRLPPKMTGEDVEWLAAVDHLAFHNQFFRLVMLAPAADFDPMSRQLVLTLAWVVAAIAALAVLGTRLTVRAVQGPLTSLFSSIEHSRRQTEIQMLRRNNVAAITARLQQAQNPAELAACVLSELAPRLGLGQALFCLWDEGAGRLRVAATYAGGGKAIDGVPPPLGNLLSQCAADRQVIILGSPGREYLRIHSGLGDALPAAIVIQPVQFGGRLFAVLELAGLHDFREEDRLLLADLEPIIAMSLDILLRAERTADLLARTAAEDERNRMILGSVGDGIWCLDCEGRTTFVNRTALEMLGYDEAEVVGGKMHELVQARHPDGREFPIDESAMSLTARDGAARTVDDEVFWHKDGRAIDVEYSTTAVRVDDRIFGVVVVFRDVGWRRAADAARRDNEAQALWQILDESPVAIAISSEDGRLLKCNQRQADLLGVAKDGLEMGQVAGFWVSPEERSAFIDDLRKSGDVRNREARFRRGDGREIRVSLTTRWVERGGERLLLSWMEEIPGHGADGAGRNAGGGHS